MTEYELEELLNDMDPEWMQRFPDPYVAAEFYDIDLTKTLNAERKEKGVTW